MRPVCLLILAFTALAVAPATAASPGIVPQRSILGVELRMTEASVRAELGAPDEINRPTHEIFGSYKEFRYGLTYVSMFSGADGEVFSVSTTSKRPRTSKGAGVGSTETALRKAVPKLTCKTEFGFRHCYRGQFLAGRVVTDFFISRKGRVKRIVLGRVID